MQHADPPPQGFPDVAQQVPPSSQSWFVGQAKQPTPPAPHWFGPISSGSRQTPPAQHLGHDPAHAVPGPPFFFFFLPLLFFFFFAATSSDPNQPAAVAS